MEDKILFPKIGGFVHGGDYNPEQWLDRPDILEKDVEMMKKAGINSATIKRIFMGKAPAVRGGL